MTAKIEAFVAEAFAMRTAAHMAHLRTPSYARHIALGDFYEAIGEHGDRFAEVWMGLHDKRIPELSDPVLPTGDPLTFLREYLTYLDDNRAVCEDDPTLENIHADMREATARALYKLKFLGA